MRHAERHYSGPVFPGEYPGPSSGPAHEADDGHHLYCGAFLCKILCILWDSGAVFSGERQNLQGWFSGNDPRHEAADCHFNFYSSFEYVLYPGAGNCVFLDFSCDSGGYLGGCFYGAAHCHADYGHLFDDLYHKPHCTDRCD